MNRTTGVLSRREFLFSLAGLGFGGMGYVRFIEPRWLELTRTTVRLPAPHLDEPVRLLHFSDFHLSDVVPLDFIRRAIDIGLRTRPDLICITGDFITGRLEDAGGYRAALRRLAEFAPTFASLGNHDGGAWARFRDGYADCDVVKRLLEESGVVCLRNQAETLSIGKQPIHLVGMGDLWASDFRPAPAFARLPEERTGPTIVLSHNPDTKSALQRYRWEMMLSGHTHGGQLYLPLIGAPFAPVEDRRFVEGLHSWEGRQLYITRGVGNVLGLRFNCRPEVSLLELIG